MPVYATKRSMFDQIAALPTALAAVVEDGFFRFRSSVYIYVVIAGSGSDVSYGPIFSRFHRLPSHWDIREKIQCPRKH
jgi:hypothetical protein